jgi:hypothetical protein
LAFRPKHDAGEGDFGQGLYTFMLCGEEGGQGLEEAITWAKRQSKVSGYPPAMVYFRIRTSTFLHLRIGQVIEEYGPSVYHGLYPRSRTGFDVVFGPVFTGNGALILDLPTQYKFEGRGIDALEVYSIKRVPQWRANRDAKR